MILKIIGAVLIVVGCGSIGFRIAVNQRREEKMLRQLIWILDYMECELQYRLTPLPALCRQVAKTFPGLLGKAFWELALEMEAQISPDMDGCMDAVLKKMPNIPSVTRQGMTLLGRTVGRFDMDGQLRGIDAVRQECRRNMDKLNNNLDQRLRSYQTLGLCAGAALAILFV